MFTEPFTQTLVSHKRKKRDTNISKQANRRSRLYNTMLLKSVCKWDIQLCSDIKAPLYLSSLGLFCILSIFKREWRRFNTAAIFRSIMLCLCPLPNDVSKSVYFFLKRKRWAVRADGESVSSFKAVEFCHSHPRRPVSYNYNFSIKGYPANSLNYDRKPKNKS